MQENNFKFNAIFIKTRLDSKMVLYSYATKEDIENIDAILFSGEYDNEKRRFFVTSEWFDNDVAGLCEIEEFKYAQPILGKTDENEQSTKIVLKEILIKMKNDDKIIAYPLGARDIENVEAVLLIGGDNEEFKHAFIMDECPEYWENIFYEFENFKYTEVEFERIRSEEGNFTE